MASGQRGNKDKIPEHTGAVAFHTLFVGQKGNPALIFTDVGRERPELCLLAWCWPLSTLLPANAELKLHLQKQKR